MVEVGYRFNSFYFAINDKNYDLAQYQWDKIKKAIENGTQRRPKRKKNSEAMFIDVEYKVMSEALDSKNGKNIQNIILIERMRKFAFLRFSVMFIILFYSISISSSKLFFNGNR